MIRSFDTARIRRDEIVRPCVGEPRFLYCSKSVLDSFFLLTVRIFAGSNSPCLRIEFYELTADDHVAAPPTIVDCPDDTAAIEKARQRLDHRIIEVWQVDRCVIRMQPIV
jgi:hypothetical protein